jgi:hypothetical protein
MPIKRLLERHVFPPELVVILGEVFEDVLKTLSLTNREDPVTELVAKKVIELAQSGERNPDRLKALTVQAFTPQQHAKPVLEVQAAHQKPKSER